MSATPTHRSTVPRFVKFNNAILGTLLKTGVPVGPNILLTVPGRKTGIAHTTPVAIMELNGQRYVQSSFGHNIDWVKNLRASGTATIRKGQHEERIRAKEITSEEAAPVFQKYIPKLPGMMRRQFGIDIANDAPLGEFVDLAKAHPMFRIESIDD